MMRRSGVKPGGEALEILLGDVAPCGIRPHRGDAIVEIRRRLADRGRRHQGMAGGAVLAAPGRGSAVGRRRAALRLRLRWRFSRPGEDVAEQVRQSIAADDCAAVWPDTSKRRHNDRAGPHCHDVPVRRHVVSPAVKIRLQKAPSRFPIA